ncbi:MAG: domain S-box protein [Ramlibacter sp.]|jgi:PAS domain S-box-containing protein|uniref:PAS domain-containing sensor histidine kinase n=1 Tax=Ramlibacter sp. TaxID=1917967 RepID=UPI0026119146|nr:HAMP domain-containing sensor histidine kinase [Ramlibacter sp.]MDB5753347.1 domain S-box protein [Ramlibacter sp.]
MEANSLLSDAESAPARESPFAGAPGRSFAGFLEAAPDAVVILDEDGLIVRVNGQTERLFGYLREELAGRRVEMLMPARFRHAHVGKRLAYAMEPVARSMGRGLELFGQRKDGSEFPIDVSLSALLPEAGPLVASTIRDMTAQRGLEADLRLRTLQLEQADLQKDQFLAALAHEFRSPLAVLTNLEAILRSAGVSPETQLRAVAALGRQTAHMTRLTEDLLDVSRVRRGEVTLRREAVDLRTVFLKAVELGQPIIQARKHRLEVAPFQQAIWVNGDGTRLVQVVANLLNNAAKYTPICGTIHLSAVREDHVAAIRVRDNGIGIPADMLARVFDLFVQVTRQGEGGAEGLGLGLTLVRRLVELHGGMVAAASEGLGKGSEFLVRLPTMQQPAVAHVA